MAKSLRVFNPERPESKATLKRIVAGFFGALLCTEVISIVGAALAATFAYDYALRSLVPSLPYVSVLTGLVLAVGVRAARFLVVK